MGRNAQQRRKARKVKIRRSSAPAFGGPVMVVADHQQTPAGWTSDRYAGMPGGQELHTTVGPCSTAREMFHEAMAAVRALADDVGPVMTLHRLDGSTDRGALLAAREGLTDDAGCDCGQCRAEIVAL